MATSHRYSSPTTIAILAGGRSSRMGFDKATAFLDGLPMLTHLVRTAATVAERVVIVGRASADFLPLNLPIDFLPDEQPDARGPAAGILALLKKFSTPALVLSCDTPLLTPPTLAALWQFHLASNNPIATLATTPHPAGHPRPEPLFAVYTPAALSLLEQIHSTHAPLHSLLTHPGVVPFPLTPPMAAELFNVNDPAALAEANASLQRRKELP